MNNFCSENPPSEGNKVRGHSCTLFVFSQPVFRQLTLCSWTQPKTWRPCSAAVQFITKLFNTPGKTVRDMSTGTDHVIEPQNLAHRVLQVRAPSGLPLVCLQGAGAWRCALLCFA